MERSVEQQIGQRYPQLLRTALRMTGDPDEAADLTQQACYKAVRNWHLFNGRSQRMTWLHQILVNSVRDWARKRATGKPHSLDDWCLPDVSSGGDPVDRMIRDEKMTHLRETIETLTETLRVAFIATVLGGYTYEQAAELLTVPTGTIASRVHEARHKVRKAMRSRFPEG